MSDHDPFDGIYDSAPPAAAVANQRAKDDPKDEPKDERETYSATFLRRSDKADLQKIAKDRGLDTSGGRNDLISRIEADQKR